ncbi:unnamed protein product [Caenorhabditis brenneri]
MADHQPYAMDNWNIGIPRRPVSLHPEAALNENDTRRAQEWVNMMLSQINDGDSVTAHYLAGHQNEADDFELLGAERPVNVGSMKDQRVRKSISTLAEWIGKAGLSKKTRNSKKMQWSGLQEEEHNEAVVKPMAVPVPAATTAPAPVVADEEAMGHQAPNDEPTDAHVGGQEDEAQDQEQPEEPMDIGAPEIAVEEAMEDPAPVAAPVVAPVEGQEDEAEGVEVQEMNIEPMDYEDGDVVEGALMKAALDAPLVDEPGSPDIDYPVEMMEAEQEVPAQAALTPLQLGDLALAPSPAETPAPGPTSTPEPAPASSTLPDSASSSLSATIPEPVAQDPSTAETPAPAPASLPLPAQASSPLPAPTATPAAQAPAPAESAPVPVQLPAPTADDKYTPLQENRPALVHAERMIEYVLIRSGVPCRHDSDDDFDPLVPAPDPHARRIFSGRRWRGRPFKKRPKKYLDAFAPVDDAPAPPTADPASDLVAPAAPVIVPAPALLAPAPALLAPTPPAPASTLATISLAPQLAWQPWVPAGNKATARTLIPKVAQKKAATPRRAPKRRRQTQAEIREELQKKQKEEQKKKDQQRRERELRAQKLAVKRMEREAELKEEQQRRERDERAKRLPAKRKAAQDLLDAKRMKKN